jgi:hypothetical protein
MAKVCHVDGPVGVAPEEGERCSPCLAAPWKVLGMTMGHLGCKVSQTVLIVIASMEKDHRRQ